MSTKKRKKKREQGRNPLKTFFYIFMVLVLMACIVFFVYKDREKDKEFEQQVEDLSAQEKADMWDEFENENLPVPSDEPDDSEALGNDDNQDSIQETANENHEDIPETADTPEVVPSVTDIAAEPTSADGVLPSQTPLPTDFLTAGPSLTPPPAEIASLSVLILNGTRKQGVAGYWKTVLEQAGYTNVTPATYTGSVGTQTVIYTTEVSKAELLLQLFPNASIQIGSVTTGIEATTGYPLPAQTDIYVLIGSSDARNS